MSQKYSHHKSLKKAIEVVAKEFLTFFADQIQKKIGIRPDASSISIQSVDIKTTVGRRRELYLADLSLSTDVGVQETRLFIKIFKDHSKVLQEASGAIELEDQLKQQQELAKNESPRVLTPKLLYYSKEWNILVYEGIYANEFDNFNLCSLDDKMMLIGSILPKIQGYTMKQVDLQRYYLLLERSLNELQTIIDPLSLPNYTKKINQIRDLLVQELEQRMFYCLGGAKSFGDFHTGNIMLQSTHEKISNLFNENSGTINYETLNRIQVWVLDPEFFDVSSVNFDCIDRMEDIAGLFANFFLSEFSEKNTISETKKLIDKFFMGYNLDFNSKIGIKLFDCYPKGGTLEYQLSQNLLYDLLYYLRNQLDPELMKKGFHLRINLIKKILKDRIS